MRATVLTVAVAAAGLAGCGSLSPLTLPPPGACSSDTQCKGERICVNGQCVWPDQGDGGPGVRDGGPTVPDGGPMPVDGGPGVRDGGPTVPDGGPMPVDGGPGIRDGGPGPVDGGPGTPGGGPAPGAVGAACQTTSDCTALGARCFGQFPGGYCLVPGCGNGTCPQGSTCVTSQATRVCLESCNTDADCRTGYTCSTFLGPAVCLPAQGGGRTPVGGACTSANQCAGQPAVCFTQWPRGYCATYNCTQDPCAAGSTCTAVGSQSLCFRNCNASGDCGRTDYVCQPLGLTRPGACVPRCDVVKICGKGQTCNTTTGLCQ